MAHFPAAIQARQDIDGKARRAAHIAWLHEVAVRPVLDDLGRPAVVERRDDNPGCETKTITKQDSDGNSVTKTKTNC